MPIGIEPDFFNRRMFFNQASDARPGGGIPHGRSLSQVTLRFAATIVFRYPFLAQEMAGFWQARRSRISNAQTYLRHESRDSHNEKAEADYCSRNGRAKDREHTEDQECAGAAGHVAHITGRSSIRKAFAQTIWRQFAPCSRSASRFADVWIRGCTAGYPRR